MNIVVAGGGVIGLRIAEQLMTTHDVVCLGAREKDRARLERLEIESIEGAITSPSALRSARVDEADVFIAASRDDEKNIVACVAARRKGASRVVCFLNRRGFLAVESDEEALAESLGIDAIVRPASQLSDEIVQIVSVPGALDARSFVGGRVKLQKFEVDVDSPLTRGPLSELKLPKGVLAVMGHRGEDYFIPHGATHFAAGDRVTLMGTARGIRRLHAYLTKQRRRKRGRAVIVGGGLVGTAVAEGLLDAGWRVKVIENERSRCTEVAGQLDCLVIQGDGTDLDLLEQEMAEEPDAVVAVTSNDEKNLLISLLAQHLKVPRVITRADKLINERIFERVGVDVVLSAKGAAIRRVVHDIVESNSLHVAELEHGDFAVLEIELPDDFVEVALKNLTLPGFAIVGAIHRGRDVRIPTGNDHLLPGDELLVVCGVEHEDEVQATLGVAPTPPKP